MHPAPGMMPNFAGSIGSYISQIQKLSSYDDDSVDRLNYVYTTYILLSLTLTLFATNYVGEPLQCWDIWEAFAESYCFVENTYFVPMNDTNLPLAYTREDREMIYYQWVPFILLVMGFFFWLPRTFWKIFATYRGLAIADLMSTAKDAAKDFANTKKIDELDKARYAFNHTLFVAQEVSRTRMTKYGSQLYNLFIIKKILILVNLVLQFFLINQYLGTAYTFWGAGILWDMLNGRQWQESGHFPRVAFCDFTVRELGNVNNWTVQCVLMVNMFNEKIFIFLWFWFAALLVITFINTLIWLHRRMSSENRHEFLVALLSFAQAQGHEDGSVVDSFYHQVLKNDGVLVLRLMDSNSGRFLTADFAKKLWYATHPILDDGTSSETEIESPKTQAQTVSGKRKLPQYANLPLMPYIDEEIETDD